MTSRLGVMLAQKDERGVLKDRTRKILRETVETLFADIAHEGVVTLTGFPCQLAVLGPARLSGNQYVSRGEKERKPPRNRLYLVNVTMPQRACARE
jgi:hypothetical protein